MNELATEEDLKRAMALADDARKMSTTLAAFQPTPGSFVEVCYGPGPFELDLPVSAQPNAYTVYWIGDPREKPPEGGDATLYDTENDVALVLWLIADRLDVVALVQRHWGRVLQIPAARVLS